MSDQRTLEALGRRLQALEDVEAIRKLYIAYGSKIDAGDAAGLAALFAQNGELRLGFVRADGPTAIEEGIRKMIDTPKPHRTLHLIASPTIEIDGDAATGESAWVAIAAREGEAPNVLSMGRHLDRFVREDGTWKFARRKGVLDIGGVVKREAAS